MAKEFRARKEGEKVADYRVAKEAWKRKQEAKAQEGSKAAGDAKPTKLEGEKTSEYRNRVGDWREAPASKEPDVKAQPYYDTRGRDATHYVDHSKSGLEKYVKITEKNNPYKRKIDAFDTTATGAGAEKGTSRYGASDMRSHLAAGKSKEDIINYAESLGDDVKMGSAANKLLEKYKTSILTEKPYKPLPDTSEDSASTVVNDNSTVDNSVDNSIKDSNNKVIEDSNNIDKSVDNSYNTIIDKSNSGVQGNTVDNQSVIVNNGGQGMAGGNKVTITGDSFEGDFDVKGKNINFGYQNTSLDENIDKFSGLNQYANVEGSDQLMDNIEAMYSAGVSGQLAINGNPYSTVIGDFNVPKPLTTASYHRDLATAQPLTFRTRGDTYFNSLFGYRGA